METHATADLPGEYLNPEQVEALYQIPPKTLTTWRYRRTGPPFVKVGALVRYRRSDLEAWLASRTVTPAGKP